MSKSNSLTMKRRHFISVVAGAGALAMSPSILSGAEHRKGRLKQAVCPGVFSGLKLDFEGQCREAAKLGAHGIDLVGPDKFPMLKKYGLIPTMVPGGSGIQYGINDKKNHADIDRKTREAIKAAADALTT